MQLNTISAVSAYLLMVQGLHAFVIQPNADETIRSALLRSLALGIMVFGVYDFTAGAVFQGSVFVVASGVAHTRRSTLPRTRGI